MFTTAHKENIKLLSQNDQIVLFILGDSAKSIRYSGVPAVRSGRAVRSYCAGLSHRPVSAPIPNADFFICH